MTPPPVEISGDLFVAGQRLIRGLSVDCPPGGWTCLLGVSGVGKSSLARIVANLPGAQELDGRIAFGDSGRASGRVTLMAQEAGLLPWATAEANVTIGARLRGEPADRDRARALLTSAGLGGLEKRRPSELSGGQRQRVALARTLMEDCPVVVLDEPFSALDMVTRMEMQDLAARLLKGRTVLMITHDPLEAVRLADRAYLLTPAGSEAVTLPPSPAPRPAADAATLTAQAALLSRLCATDQA